MPGFGWSEGLQAAGLLANAVTGRSQANSSKEMLRRQTQGIQMMNQNARMAQPYWQAALQQYANMAGVQPGSAGTQGIANEREFGLGGGFGDRSQQLRFQAAEEDLDKIARLRGGRLQSQLAGRGIASGTQAAAMAGNERDYMSELAKFRRGLAINQGQEQERRMAALMGILGQGMNQGQVGAQMAGQQGQYYGQQAGQSFAGAGQIVQDYMQQQALQDYMRQYGVNGGGDGGYGLRNDFNRLIATNSSPMSGAPGSSGTPVLDPMTGRVIGYR